MHPGRLWLWVLGLKWASVQQATAMLSAPRHGEVWRGCPAAPRADRQAQDAREQGPAWQAISDAENASEPQQCVSASSHLAGPPTDHWGGERTGCAGLQSTEGAAAAGGSATLPPFWEEAKDMPVTARDGGCRTWVVEAALWPAAEPFAWSVPWAEARAPGLCSPLLSPLKSDHPPACVMQAV